MGRFHGGLLHLAIFVGAWIVGGGIYSIIRWFWECKKLGNELYRKCSLIVSWPAEFSIEGIFSNYTTKFQSKEDAFKFFEPRLTTFYKNLFSWSSRWPMLLIHSCLSGFFKGLNKLFKNIFQRISSKIYTSSLR